MASVASHLIEEFTAHAQSDSLEDEREICADDTYFPNNLRINNQLKSITLYVSLLNIQTMQMKAFLTSSFLQV